MINDNNVGTEEVINPFASADVSFDIFGNQTAPSSEEVQPVMSEPINLGVVSTPPVEPDYSFREELLNDFTNQSEPAIVQTEPAPVMEAETLASIEPIVMTEVSVPEAVIEPVPVEPVYEPEVVVEPVVEVQPEVVMETPVEPTLPVQDEALDSKLQELEEMKTKLSTKAEDLTNRLAEIQDGNKQLVMSINEQTAIMAELGKKVKQLALDKKQQEVQALEQKVAETEQVVGEAAKEQDSLRAKQAANLEVITRLETAINKMVADSQPDLGHSLTYKSAA